MDPEHGQLTDEFCIAEERGLLRSKRARAEPTKAYSEIQAEEDTERREASLQRAAAKRKALEDAKRRRLQEKQRQTIALQHANRVLMQQQRVYMPIVLPPSQPVATSVKPGARYPVKGETAVCPTLQWAIRAQEAEILPCRTEMGAFRVQKAHMRQCPCHHAYWLMCVDYTSFCRIPSPLGV